MILGLTGGIGSGKSTVAKVLQTLGFPVFEADQAGRDVLDHDPEVIKAVQELFGASIYEGGKANRPEIASHVFSDPGALNALNQIIHPAVARSWKAWAARHEDAAVLVREAAILFESGSYKDCDRVLTISTDEAVRIQRVMQRDGVSETEVRARMKRQWTDEQRRERADFEIVNDGQQAVIPQLMELLPQLTTD